MVNQFSRTQLLLGKEGMERLFHARRQQRLCPRCGRAYLRR